MTWKNERDLLIAQTMAFVQSVMGKAADAGDRSGSLSQSEPADARSPREALGAGRPVPLRQSDMREEIQQRVAAFRARQQLFQSDRDQYFNATLAKARAANEQAAKASDHQPAKR